MTLQWRGKFLEVHCEGTWEYAARTRSIGAAVILALTEAREIVLVEQFRVPFGRTCIELPAGLVGDEVAGEAEAASAARELHEETGFEAAHWEDLGEFATSPGMSNESFRLYRATGLTRTGAGGGTPEEAITVHIVALSGLAEWLAVQRARGCIIDCRLVVGLGLV
ncbi:MAG TPA: NUDIX hydrolase [Polymorphobacter sp.]|jgi:ADP-ribose pyrophosphatase|nr:NUDIX hydrolase [Polymorphobacter sp.]